MICDCTSLTQAGYVGDDVETVIAKLLQVSHLCVYTVSVSVSSTERLCFNFDVLYLSVTEWVEDKIY